MKKQLLKKLAITISVVISIFIIVFLFARYSDNIPDADTNLQVKAILEDNSCLVCHTTTAELPFYGSFPIIGTQVKEDVRRGIRAFNMDGMTEEIIKTGKLSEVNNAKLENAIAKGTMPLQKFSALHWSSHMNGAESKTIAQWTKDVRANHYSSKLASEEFSDEPIQPIVESIPTSADKVALGIKLFHDTRLSIDNTLSCASCHGLTTAGVDNKRYSEGVDRQFGDINAPTVYNAALNFIQFWDGRAENLAAQASGPPTNPVEMGAHSWADICSKLNADKALVAEFTKIYGDTITEKNVTDAISEFEKTLITPDSRFDSYLKGNKDILSEAEIAGYAAFKQYDCHTCHVGQNLGGQSFEYMGLNSDYFNERGDIINADHGRFNFSGDEADKHKFKTPGLRNIALTHPYFHDGTVETLEDAVRKMAKYQTKHDITDVDVTKITAFLNTLSSQKLEKN